MLLVLLVAGALAILALGWFVLQIRLLKGALEAYQHHRPGDALKRSRRCLALRPLPPLRPIAFQVCGLAHSALGAVSEAERCFRAALESPSPGVQARSAVLLAGLAHRDGRLKEARELLLRGREDPSTRRDACVGLVELLINEGDFDRARMEAQGRADHARAPRPRAETRVARSAPVPGGAAGDRGEPARGGEAAARGGLGRARQGPVAGAAAGRRPRRGGRARASAL
ncbi:MAG: hypothetical protein QM765_25620 [Myxococcales bacterium]